MGMFITMVLGGLIGFTICSVLIYLQVNRMVEILNSVNAKYQTMVSVISAWQHDLVRKV